jgi:mRNA interferase RelE/StbE
VARRTHRIEFTPAADRDFRGLPHDVQRRLRPKIDSLAGNPRPHSVETLAGKKDLHRIRVGDHRIVYQIRDEVLLVVLVKFRHRRDVYRKL